MPRRPWECNRNFRQIIERFLADFNDPILIIICLGTFFAFKMSADVHFFRAGNIRRCGGPEYVQVLKFEIHIYPFWTKTPFKDAIQETINEYNKTKEKYPNIPVIITELGWPTSSDFDLSYTNVENHKAYIEGIDKWAREHDVLVYYFEAFDEPWKGGNNPVEPEKH